MTFDWKPSPSEARTWTIVGIVTTFLALPLFVAPTILSRRSGTVRVDLGAILLVVVLTGLLVVVHEAIHALVMLAFGARPSFGVVLVGKSMPALFATSTGHLFSRPQYLAVAASPGLIISVLGLSATLAPWGAALILPLAIHLGGCVGDAAAIVQVARQPRGTMYEDLRDGIRFYRA